MPMIQKLNREVLYGGDESEGFMWSQFAPNFPPRCRMCFLEPNLSWTNLEILDPKVGIRHRL